MGTLKKWMVGGFESGREDAERLGADELIESWEMKLGMYRAEVHDYSAFQWMAEQFHFNNQFNIK